MRGPSPPSALGVYLSIPFCQAKCSFCNFASDVHASSLMQPYIARVLEEMRGAPEFAASQGAEFCQKVDTLYFGGGTPSLLPADLVKELFDGLKDQFQFTVNLEATVEAAPGQLAPESLAAFQEGGVTRVSLGVQSFQDREARAVGRLHSPKEALAEIRRLRQAGISRVALDLILGLPHQTHSSFVDSLQVAMASGVDHLSLYMLEVDDKSRLGQEYLRQGPRYGAAHLPAEEAVADWYLEACETLQREGFPQYEISNFARPGCESRHNIRYWQRRPYLGLGADAHSMLRSADPATYAVRWSNASTLADYLQRPGSPFVLLGAAERTPAVSKADNPQAFALSRQVEKVDQKAAFEEAVFLGLRMNCGVSLAALREEFGPETVKAILPEVHALQEINLVMMDGDTLRLTAPGRTLSNEVFSRLLLP